MANRSSPATVLVSLVMVIDGQERVLVLQAGMGIFYLVKVVEMALDPLAPLQSFPTSNWNSV